ncbi:MAG: pilus assembly protein [Nevskiaceae bacterium]|nr:MAG: pilus assembly protein [Nevskiaceae bacterium]
MTSTQRFPVQCGRRGNKQGGSAAVEFAMVFPLLLILTYSAIVYGYIFMLQEALTFTAQQAASSAIAVSPQLTTATARSKMTTLAQTTAYQALQWLGAQSSRVVGTGGEKVQVTFCNQGGQGCPTDTDAITVKMIFDMNVPTPLFPVISFGGLMGMGSLPPIPDQITAQAMVRI